MNTSLFIHSVVQWLEFKNSTAMTSLYMSSDAGMQGRNLGTSLLCVEMHMYVHIRRFWKHRIFRSVYKECTSLKH